MNRRIMKKVVNSNYDILKIILALMVLLIHSRVFPKILFPWLIIAVPLFFMISSYFFFSKIKKLENENEIKKELKSYILRNLKLYLFWFIALLPITLEMRGYYVDRSFIKGTLIIIRDFLFFGTFPASWFIIALIISTLIIFYLSKKLTYKRVFLIVLVIYLIVTLRWTYSFLFNNISIYQKFVRYYELFIKYSYNSFPFALIWTFLGKCAAEDRFKWSKKTNIFLFIFGAVTLFLESLMIRNITGVITNACYISLPLITVSIFWFVKNREVFSFKYSIFIRKLSTITYVTHASILHILFDVLIINKSIFNFFITIIICSVLTLIINYFENKRYLKWLKYAY